jgi:hypothetical protein
MAAQRFRLSLTAAHLEGVETHNCSGAQLTFVLTKALMQAFFMSLITYKIKPPVQYMYSITHIHALDARRPS